VSLRRRRRRAQALNIGDVVEKSDRLC